MPKIACSKPRARDSSLEVPNCLRSAPAVHVTVAKTASAPTMCGHTGISEWRKPAPSTTCKKITVAFTIAKVWIEGAPLSTSCGRSDTHHLLVNTAIPNTAANTICAKTACITGNQYCNNCRTTSPPNTACTTTPKTAITPNQRSQRRLSFTQISIASASAKTPKQPAITRCECSKNAPPASCLREGNQVPNDLGQSGTESAAFLDVTRAPAINRSTVQTTTKLANRWIPRLYVAVIRRNLAVDYSSAATLLPLT